MLETSQRRREISTESPTGDSFLNGQVPLVSPAKRYDFYNLSRSIEQIGDLVADIATGNHKRFTEYMLGEEARHVEDCLKSHLKTGSIIIGAAIKPLASEVYQEALQADFAITRQDVQARNHWYELPAGSVTAAQVLVRKGTETIFSPVVDLRVKTSVETPITLYDPKACRLMERPSNGHWFRFDLIGIHLSLVEGGGHNG